MDTIDSLISAGKIEPQIAEKIMSHYDNVVAKILADRVIARMNIGVRALQPTMPST